MYSFGIISVEKQNDILILSIAGGSKLQNCINREFLRCFHKALDFCENTAGERTLIITGSGNRFFSVGLDFNEVFNNDADVQIAKEVGCGFLTLLKRLLVFELPTIAAINGHCYAGGVMIALSCDWRIMLNDCGDFCLSEILLGLPMPIGYRELVRVKMTPKSLRTAVLSGKKFSAKEALNARLIDKIIMNRNDLLQQSIRFGKTVSKLASNRANYKRLKYDLYYKTAHALTYAALQCYWYVPSKL